MVKTKKLKSIPHVAYKFAMSKRPLSMEVGPNGNQLDAWASGLGDWGECEADDDDDFDEPGAWRDSMALGDCDA